MVLPYDPRKVEEAGRHFDETVRRFQALGDKTIQLAAQPATSCGKEDGLQLRGDV